MIQKEESGRAEESSTSTAAIFDKTEFISRAMGDLALSRYVASVFVENAPEYIEAIRSALAAEDASALRQSAHKLKGAAATMALQQLSAIAERLEEMAVTGGMERAVDLLPELLKRYKQSIEALRELPVTSSETVSL
jgi:HPt (histidine-containing phosphotransfer) domain-containing protein